MPDGSFWTPRIDRIAIRFDQTGATTDEDTGYLRVWGQVSHVGLLEYGIADGAPRDGWTELVPPETVFDTESNRSLLHAPVTLQHPPEFLDTANTNRFQIGSVVELDEDRQAGTLRALHLITDSRAIEEIRNGLLELSPGYTALIQRGEGSFDGRMFDATQIERRYNHQAIVTVARAGPTNALDRVDAHKRLARLFRADGLRIQLRGPTTMPKRKDETTTIAIGDKSYTVDEEVAAAFTSMQASIDEKDEALKSKDQEADEETEDQEGEEEEEDTGGRTDGKGKGKGNGGVKHEDVATMIAKSETKIVSAVVSALTERESKARADASSLAEVVTMAKPMLPKSYRVDGKTELAIMHAAIVESAPKLKAKADSALKAKDTSRMRGTFEAASIFADTQDTGERQGRKHDASGDDPYAQALARRDAMNKAALKGVPFKNGRPVPLSTLLTEKEA